MKNCLLLVLAMLSLSIAGQEIPPETFETHMKRMINEKDIIREYGVTGQDNSRHLYINLGCYDQYHQKDPLDVEGRKLFLWNEGAIFFYGAEYPLNLLRIRTQGENIVFYEFTYREQDKKYFIEVKFVKRYQDWELVDMATTKLKAAY